MSSNGDYRLLIGDCFQFDSEDIKIDSERVRAKQFSPIAPINPKQFEIEKGSSIRRWRPELGQFLSNVEGKAGQGSFDSGSKKIAIEPGFFGHIGDWVIRF